VLPLRSPGDVLLDTSFIINSVFQGLPDSAACADASDMIVANQAVVYFSAILRIEYAQALRRLATKHRRAD
jgi:predicted nucleic acid-binding protein